MANPNIEGGANNQPVSKDNDIEATKAAYGLVIQLRRELESGGREMSGREIAESLMVALGSVRL